MKLYQKITLSVVVALASTTSMAATKYEMPSCRLQGMQAKVGMTYRQEDITIIEALDNIDKLIDDARSDLIEKGIYKPEQEGKLDMARALYMAYAEEAYKIPLELSLIHI